MTEAEKERAAVVAWLREKGMDAAHMILMAGMPGGTRTQRTKNAAFADGCAHTVKVIMAGIERGDHHKELPNEG